MDTPVFRSCLDTSSLSNKTNRFGSLPATLASQTRGLICLLLVWTLVCQTIAPNFGRVQAKVASNSTAEDSAAHKEETGWFTQLTQRAVSSVFHSQPALAVDGFAGNSAFVGATGEIESFAFGPANSLLSPLSAPLPPANGIAIVRHAPSLNGNGRVEGSLRQLTGESVTLNGGAVITNDLQVPGTPTLVLNGNPIFGGTIQGTGSAQPTNYQVLLNSGTTTLGHLVTRTDPISLASVPPPPASQGTRTVTITAPGQSAGDFATLRDLTLNGNVGLFTVPPGTYRNFIGNAGSGFVFGISGASQPSTYNLNALTLNGLSQIQIVGPVNLTVGNGLTLNASMGSATNPAWLNLQLSSGGVTLNGGSSLYALVKAPAGTVIINGNAQLIGTVACDRLIINSGGLLRLTESALPPVNQPPVVSAGPNQMITLPGAAPLNGSVTDDGLPQGSSVTATWSKVSGPGPVNFANPNNAATTATFSQSGTYVLRLTATDSLLTNSSDVTITVIPQNYAPTVNAGPDRTITLPASATLNGSAGDDGLPTGSTLAVVWSKVSGPGTATFTSPSSAVTNASFSVAGIYTLRLTANDSQLSTSDDVQVVVIPENHAPTANAGADQTITLPGAASLNGSASDDGMPAGSTLTTTWSKVSGPFPGTVTYANSNAAVTTAAFSEAGTYVLRLTVSDSDLTTSDDVVVTVIPENHAPTANAGANQTLTLPSNANLNGSVSDDGLPAGSSVTSTWIKVSGPGTVTFGNSNVTVTTAVFSEAGSYVLRLTASDSELSSADEIAITVIPENHAPTANAGADQTITLPGAASLNGSASDDGLPAGSTLTTTWSKVSGPGTVTFGNPNVTVTTAAFSVAGTYVLRLSASDSALTSSDDVEVVVIPENHAPTVAAGADQTITLPNTASLNGIANDDALPSGSTLTVSWTKVSGPGIVTFVHPNAAATNAAFDVAGTYILRLTANDSQLSTSDEVQVTVIPENHAPTVSAGADQTIALPALASLNGSAADDGLPAESTLTTTWSKVSGPGTVAFGNPDVMVTTAAFSESGTYVLRLTASDSELTTSDHVVVTVDPENNAPTVNVGADQTIALPAQASLTGTVTDDGWPRNSSVTAAWSQVSGPGTATFATPGAAITAVSFSDAGSYVLRLTATDSQLSASDDVEVVVIPENHAPTVNAGTDQTVTLPNAASLNGNAADDGLPAGSTLTVAWTKVSGPGLVSFSNPSTASTTVSFAAAGTYVLRLTASDSQLTSSDDVQVTVIPENHAPTANAGVDQTITLPDTASLNGTVSDDGYPAGSTLTTTWSKVSGPGTITFASPNATVTSATFSAAGTYVLRLTASDSELSGSDEMQVVVIAENHAPTVNAGADQTVVFPANVNLNGSVSDDGLPAGSSVTSSWSKVSGPGTVTFVSPSAPVTTASFSDPGTYVLRLTASDSVLTTIDDLTIVVSGIPPVSNFIVPESTGSVGSFVIAASGSPSSAFSADKILDSTAATYWTTTGIANQFAKVQFYDQQNVYVDRVLIQAGNFVSGPTVLKDFDVQVSATTSDDASFVTVLTGTALNNSQLQEFVFPGGPVRARYIKLLLKTNYGSSSQFTLGTFNPVAVGSADRVVSLAGQPNVALSQSPALPLNGGGIYSSSYSGGVNSANNLIGYFSGGWQASNTPGQFAIIQLNDGNTYTIEGVRLATWADTGSGFATGVKDFEVWVSNTTPDAASFTKVLSASTLFVPYATEFLFPGGPVQARYVKYVPLNNRGGGTTINTQLLDVIVPGTARVVGVSQEAPQYQNSAQAAFDGVSTTYWIASGTVTDVWVKTSLANDATRQIYGVRIHPMTDASFKQGPKDFEIRVSTTTTDDSAFSTVYSGTVSSTLNAPQEFLFSNFVDARYVQFFWKNAYHASVVGVRELEVLAAPDRGSGLFSFSSGAGNVGIALDLDPTNTPWTTPLNQNTNVSFKLLLPRGELTTIGHIALRPAIQVNGNYGAPKDFEFQVSTTDGADSSFITAFAGTLVNSTQLQDFYFAPVQARYVRLVLIKPPSDFSSYALHNFLVYSSETIGTTTRFVDLSTDSDGQVVLWAWNFGDGATSPLKSPTHTFAQPGDYTVSLTVTDSSGLTNSYSNLYHVVESVNADFVLSPMVVHEGGETVSFRDTQRLLSHLDALRRYDFGDGSALYSQYAQTSLYTYPDNGVFHVTLKVGDPLGVGHTATRDITVLNVPPAIDIDPGKTLVWGEPWTSVPRITDQGPVDRVSLQGQWDFADGQTSQCVNCTNANATVTHTYAHPGTYNAVLTVTDKDGGVGFDTATFIVNKRPTAFTFENPPAQTNGQPLLIHAQLKDTFANLPLAGKPVQLTMNGALFNAVTDANGVAEVSVPVPAGTKIDLITGSFAEDEYYLSCGGVAVPSTAGDTPPSNAPSYQGTDFWLMFPYAYTDSSSAKQHLYITSPVATSGTVTIIGSGLNFTQNFTVAANTVQSVQLPSGTNVIENNVVTTKGVHVTSLQPVAVYGLNRRGFSSDAFLGLPVNSLGLNYYILTYSNSGFAPSSELGVVAAENGTIVTITPSVTSSGRTAGVPYNVTLNQGQTYLLQNLLPTVESDLSGTHVTANKPIAVFGAHEAATIPAEAVCCADHIVEQLPPTGAWGKRFATVPLATRLKGDFFRFIAAEDGTAVYLNGNLTATLNRGQWAERILKTPTEIIATKPIMVAQYSTSTNYDFGTTGKADPFMMIVPPYSQFLSHYTITTPAVGYEINYVNVVAATASLGSVTLDGVAIPPASFTPIGVSRFSGAQVAVSLGSHTLDGPTGFGVFVYGYNADEGYGYPGGMNTTVTVQSTNVAISPEASSHSINTQGCVVATVTDQSQFPLGGKALNFTVTGANPSNSSAVTDAAGQATLCYVGANVGTDQIVAAVGSAQATASIIWTPPNQAPIVNAGSDQAITLPVPANLQGSANDDGLPTNTLNVSWAKVSGPGTVTFGNPNAATTTATFDTAGVYILRLTATDTNLSAADDVQITVNPAPVNQPPTANAGSDLSSTINGNLIVNGGNDQQLVNGEISGWTEIQATTWTLGTAGTAGFPEAQRGAAYFYSGNAAQAELRQDVDLSAYAGNIAAGTQQFELKAYLRSVAEALPDAGRVVVEYRDPTNTNVIASLDSGDITTTSEWHLTEDTRVAPVGTGWIRVRLIAARNPNAANDASNDAFFDSVSLRPIGAAAVKLSGTVSDDGLPYGSSLTATWNQVSGPGAATFATPNAAVSAVSFTTPGTYVLRLTASDGQANISDDVTVVVNPANQAPVVNAGTNQTITLPATAGLNGTVTDDGQPPGSSVSVSWSKLSGPGVVTFANANQTATSASFSAAGTYVLRLTADDTEYSTAADVTITVNPAPVPVNQPPAVSPGPNQTISLPTDTVTLNGTATDDGLPAGSTLSVTWTQISGPGVVTFGNPNNAVTTAQFSAVGSYVLRLSASDGDYLVSADVGVILTPQNQAPTANAGPDQTILLSQGAQLNGSASDDGLPSGTLTTTWTKVSGPGTVTFMNPNVTITGVNFTPPAPTFCV